MIINRKTFINRSTIEIIILLSCVWHIEGVPLNGKITNETAQPVANALVELFTESNSTSPVYTIMTGLDGTFSFGDILGKVFYVKVTADPFMPQWADRIKNTLYPQTYIDPVMMTTLDTLRIIMTTTPVDNKPGKLSITVLDSTGQPVKGMGRVELRSMRGGSLYRPLDTATIVQFTNVTPDTYALFVSIPPYPDQYYDPNGNITGPSFCLRVASGDSNSMLVRLTRTPKGINHIFGKISASAGVSLSGVQMSICNLYNPAVLVATATPMSTGFFSFEGLTDYSYYLKISGTSFPEQWFSQSRGSTTTLFPDDPVKASTFNDTILVTVSGNPFDNTPKSVVTVKLFDAANVQIKTAGRVYLEEKSTRIQTVLPLDTVRWVYTANAIKAGDYFLRFTIPNYPLQYYSPDGNTSYQMYMFKVNLTDTLTFSSTLVTSFTGTATTGYGKITCAVSDSSGQKLSNARVVVYDPTMLILAESVTGTDGTAYNLSVPLSKSIVLSASAPNYPQQYWSPMGPTRTMSQMNFFMITDTMRFINFVMSTQFSDTSKTTPYPPPANTYASISGFVKSTATGKGLGNIRIGAMSPEYGMYDYSLSMWSSPWQTRSDSSGFFKLSNLQAGNYLFVAIPDSQNYVQQYYFNCDSSRGAKTVTVSDTGSITLSFNLRTGAMVTGTVQTISGQAISGATVRLNGLDGNKQWYEARTDAMGKYIIKGLMKGRYNLWAMHENYIMIHDYTTSQDYTLTEGQTTTAQTIKMQTGGRISGTYSSTATTTTSVSGQMEMKANLSLFSDTIKSTIQWSQYSGMIWFKPDSSSGRSGTFITDLLQTGNWKIIMNPEFYLEPGSAVPSNGLKPTIGWSAFGSSFSTLTIPNYDTLKNISLMVRQGYAAFGKMSFEGVTTAPNNWSITAFVNMNGAYIPVSYHCKVSGTQFALPGLVEGESYYLQMWAEGYPTQWWSPEGNSAFPSYAYKFTSSGFTPFNITMSKSIAGGNTGGDMNTPVSLWFNRTDTGLVLLWNVNSSITGVDSIALYGSDRINGVKCLYRSILQTSLQLNKWTDKQVQTVPRNYIAVVKGTGKMVRSNPIWYDPRVTTTPGSLWLDIYSTQWGMQIEWGADTSYRGSDKDTVCLYKKPSGTTDWKLISKKIAWERWMKDDYLQESDSGKTYDYKLELISNGAVINRSPVKSFTINFSFSSMKSSSVTVGPYETYKTIQSAIDAVPSGGHIQVRAGTYKENLNFRGKMISIDGDWEYGTPPVIDAAGGTAITIPFYPMDNPQNEQLYIGGFKIVNAATGISTSGPVGVNQCLFVNVGKALVTVMDTLSMQRAMSANPFVPNAIQTSLWQCTFIATYQGNMVAYLESAGAAESPTYTGPYTGMGPYYIQPAVSFSSNCYIDNSIFAYYSTKGSQTGIPIKVMGVSGYASVNNCDLWQTSSVSAPVVKTNNVFTFDPQFTDTIKYFISSASPLRSIAGLNESIGYDSRTQYQGGGGSYAQPDSVRNLQIRITGLHSIMLKWEKPAAGSVVSYRIYRVPGNSNLFYVNPMGQWDVKIPRDSMFSYIDTFSSRTTFYVDSTVIPDSGYLYAVVAVDSAGHEGSPNLPYPPPLSSYIVNKYTYQMKITANKWYMLGVWGGSSLTFTIPSPTQVLYQWDDRKLQDKLYSRYVSVSEMKPCNGYWYKSIKDTILNVNRSSLTSLIQNSDSMKITLLHGQTGWNQISSPYPFPVTPSWMSTFTLWEWNPDSIGYSRAKVMVPGSAYWVYTDADTLLNFKNVLTIPLAKKHEENIRWRIQVSLNGSGTWDPDNFAGVLVNNTGAYEEMEPPAPFGNAQLFFVKQPDENSVTSDARFSALFKTSSRQQERLEWMVGISSSSDPLQIRFNDIGSVPENIALFWVNSRGAVDLREYATVSIAAHERTEYGYIVATSDPSEIALYTNRFMMRPAYPNPFTRNTTVDFTIPYLWNADGSKSGKTSHSIAIRVYNLEGKRVATLFSGKIGVGKHHVRWDGTNGRQVTAPGGLYIIRMESRTFVHAVKVFKVR